MVANQHSSEISCFPVILDRFHFRFALKTAHRFEVRSVHVKLFLWEEAMSVHQRPKIMLDPFQPLLTKAQCHPQQWAHEETLLLFGHPLLMRAYKRDCAGDMPFYGGRDVTSKTVGDCLHANRRALVIQPVAIAH